MSYKIKTFCLGCHYCALECPVGAINYKGTQYQIDEEKCIECGVCAEVCNVSAIDRGIEAEIVSHDKIELEADLVVIGAGAGGTIAAVKAAELTGAKIIVLEKAEKYGGSGWYAGFNIGNTLRGAGPGGPPPGGQGEGAPKEAGPPPMAKRNTSYMEKLDKQLIANAQKAGVELNEWLMSLESIKPYLIESVLNGKRVYSLDDRRIWFNEKCTDGSIGPGKGGSFVIQAMVNMFESYGIKLLTRHAAKRILLDDSGAVSGVLAEDAGGETHIKCKAVILATGSYTHNDEMLKRYIPWFFPGDDNPHCEPVHRFAAPTDTGDVVALGESCGAYIDHEAFNINMFGPVHHPFSFSMYFAQIDGHQMTVNLKGKRFFDEGTMGAGSYVVCDQPRRIAYTIYTEKTLTEVCDSAVRSRTGVEGDYLKLWRQDIQDELNSNNGVSLFIADSIEELAEKTSIDKAGLLAEVERYNSFCEKGVDEDFGKRKDLLQPIKDGPFYAIFGKVATDGAFGGVLVNPKCEVYNAKKTGVVPGLYAIGDNASGVQANPGEQGDFRQKAFGDFAWAANGGYLAAQSLSEYLKLISWEVRK